MKKRRFEVSKPKEDLISGFHTIDCNGKSIAVLQPHQKKACEELVALANKAEELERELVMTRQANADLQEDLANEQTWVPGEG